VFWKKHETSTASWHFSIVSKKKQHIINGLVQGKTLTGNRGFYHGKYMGFSG
jgi:hypothetical protein